MEKPFEPSGVTKPIQLLSAWLIGLIFINGSFLAAASQISRPDWAAGALVVATIANVPVFLTCLFLLQTKFRPEMQEDAFYDRYLERRFSSETSKVEYVEVRSGAAEDQRAAGRRTISPKRAPFLPDVVEEKGYKLRVNDLLARYPEIISSLRAFGLAPDDTFGSTSQDASTPTRFVVSAGREAPVDAFQKVLSALEAFDVEGVSLARNDFNQRHIYVGSYIYEKEDEVIQPLSPQFRQLLLDRSLTQERMESLLAKGC